MGTEHMLTEKKQIKEKCFQLINYIDVVMI